MSDLAKRLRETTHMYQADCELKWKCAARIDELEALYDAAKHDAEEAEAYAEALEAKLYDIRQEEMKTKDRGPWPNAIRAVNYRISTKKNGSPIWAHRIEQYHEGRWTSIRVYNESEDGTLEEEKQ
jgi:RNA binding exosome subunit